MQKKQSPAIAIQSSIDRLNTVIDSNLNSRLVVAKNHPLTFKKWDVYSGHVIYDQNDFQRLYDQINEYSHESYDGPGIIKQAPYCSEAEYRLIIEIADDDPELEQIIDKNIVGIYLQNINLNHLIDNVFLGMRDEKYKDKVVKIMTEKALVHYGRVHYSTLQDEDLYIPEFQKNQTISLKNE